MDQGWVWMRNYIEMGLSFWSAIYNLGNFFPMTTYNGEDDIG